MSRPVFFISDSTGITAETLGQGLLSQFENVAFERTTLPYIDSTEKAKEVVTTLNALETKPIVIATLLNKPIRKIVFEANVLVIDLFNQFLPQLEAELGVKAAEETGRSHGFDDSYMSRIDAVNFALSCDDGLRPKHYDRADIILIGVSRSGKTPTCLYLALQFGIHAANFPLTDDELDNQGLPKSLMHVHDKLFGLLIDPQRLQAIRSERRPNSQYASMAQCRSELKRIEELYRAANIPYLNTTTRSVEEIATQVLNIAGIKRS